jgi:hypothetical protein
MADLTVVANISRSLLALGDLNLNDYVNFTLATPILGGEEAWKRNSQGSAYMDGEVEVNASRGNITETIGVWVTGSTHANMMANVTTLKQAFNQATYELYLSINGTVHEWRCYRANSSYEFSTGLIASRKVKWTFQVPRNPVPITGGF